MVMNTYHYLIVGGGIAGVTAAETIRARDANANIGIVSAEPYPLYSRVLLPAYLKQKIPREKLFLRTLDDFAHARIDMRPQETVTAIHERQREVELENGIRLGYKKLLIATGGRVRPWGRTDDAGLVYRLQTLDDADRMARALPAIANPLVVGSSFISLEFLEIFLENNIIPTLIMREKHFFSAYLEKTGGELLRDHFERNRINVIAEDEIARIRQRTDGVPGADVLTRKGTEISCDAIAVGVGIERNKELRAGSDIIAGTGGVRVNEFLRTNHEDIFSAGDSAEVYDPVSRIHRALGNWTNAFLQGAHAGRMMLGESLPFRAVPTYSITNLGFQITALGDCRDHANTIVRIDPDRSQYERLFLRDHALHGAFLMNRFQDKTHLAKLIETNAPLTPYLDQLRTFAFDIHAIPVVS